jgi:hypothetical protein
MVADRVAALASERAAAGRTVLGAAAVCAQPWTATFPSPSVDAPRHRRDHPRSRPALAPTGERRRALAAAAGPNGWPWSFPPAWGCGPPPPPASLQKLTPFRSSEAQPLAAALLFWLRPWPGAAANLLQKRTPFRSSVPIFADHWPPRFSSG